MRRLQTGLTLIEVVIALAILAIAILAILQVSNQQIRHLRQLDKRYEHINAANNLLMQLRTGLLGPGDSPGQIQLAHRPQAWQVSTSKQDGISAQTLHIKPITLTRYHYEPPQ